MPENVKKPQIRFKGFTDAWEQRKLNNYLIVSDEKNSENLYKKEDVLSVSGDFGIVNQIKFQGRSFAGTSVLNYGVVHKGDVVYTKSPLKATPYGIIKTNKGSTGIVSVLYGVYHTKENANADFIQVYFEENARLNNYLRPLVNKGAKNTLLISDEEALNGEVNFAPSLNEQLKISVVFNCIDNLITLHQRKLDKLKNIKKSMLEKMFQKNGSNVPEIRFKGFTDAWEQRTVGNLIKDYIERTVIQNQYPVLTSSQQLGIVLQEEYFADRQVTTNDNIGYFILPFGYFTYRSRSDTNVFVFNRNNIIDKGIISYFYPVFYPENCDSNFLMRRLNHGIEKQISMAAEGTGQKVLAHSKFKNMIVNVPKKEEQIKIGNVFEKIDNLITLHQRKLEKLQNIKKACLEKMFV